MNNEYKTGDRVIGEAKAAKVDGSRFCAGMVLCQQKRIATEMAASERQGR
jgi:hypothetical protein